MARQYLAASRTASAKRARRSPGELFPSRTAHPRNGSLAMLIRWSWGPLEFPFFLVLWEIWIGLHFIHLLCVAFAVCRNEQNEFIAIQLHPQRAVHGVIPQTGGGFQIVFCSPAAFHEVLQRAFG